MLRRLHDFASGGTVVEHVGRTSEHTGLLELALCRLTPDRLHEILGLCARGEPQTVVVAAALELHGDTLVSALSLGYGLGRGRNLPAVLVLLDLGHLLLQQLLGPPLFQVRLFLEPEIHLVPAQRVAGLVRLISPIGHVAFDELEPYVARLASNLL